MVDRFPFATSLPSSANCDFLEQSKSCFIHSGLALFNSISFGIFTTRLQINSVKLSGGLFLIACIADGFFIHRLADFGRSCHFHPPVCCHLVASSWSKDENIQLGNVCKERKGQEKEVKCR